MERETLKQRTGFDGPLESYVDIMVEQVKSQVGGKKVLCALSGGVDSSVCAALVHKAVGDQLIGDEFCIICHALLLCVIVTITI